MCIRDSIVCSGTDANGLTITGVETVDIAGESTSAPVVTGMTLNECGTATVTRLQYADTMAPIAYTVTSDIPVLLRNGSNDIEPQLLWDGEYYQKAAVEDVYMAVSYTHLLWRAAGSPEPKNMSSFTDVPADSYYAKAVAWAVKNGITGGTGNGKFSPDAPCTRAQMATFLWRANGSPKVTGTTPFSDVSAGTDVYKRQIHMLSRVTISGGEITNNTASGSGIRYGGGIYSESGVTVSNVTITGNSANEGGGIYGKGAITLTDATVTDNQKYDVYYDGGESSAPKLTVSGLSLIHIYRCDFKRRTDGSFEGSFRL